MHLGHAILYTSALQETNKERIRTMTDNTETVGISPKAWAATVGAFLATVIVGYVGDKVGLGIDVESVSALVVPLLTAVFTFLAAYAAKAGLVVNKDANVPDAPLPPPVNPNV
jgi:hypothetical protein